MFQKVLIANRGEIAVRVMRSLHEMGIATVAVFSEADREALHVRMADEAVCVGPAASAESYLVIDRILQAARDTGAEAIHPGYGFLSENAAFARACEEANVTFIGPSPHAIDVMGEKTRARQLMAEAGVPLVPGTPNAVEDAGEALKEAQKMGFPVLIKAAAGGGGKGMRRVDEAASFQAAFEGARREAISAFGNGDVYVEKYVLKPRHVEIQVLADGQGNVVHLFERDCSVQRRHQKVIEETPCPVLSEATRQAMGEVAVQAARAVDYVGAGTVEFLLDHEENFYFLEMNTRLQVEHPITEMITGVDLVRWQVRIAAGEPLTLRQEDLAIRGAAVECRIYAEDPENQFRPSPGLLVGLRPPSGPGVREDSGVYEGATVPVHYDPMISKLITWGEDRDQAVRRMGRALREYVITGIKTNLAFHREVLVHPDFLSGQYDTDFVPRWLREREQKQDDSLRELAEIAAVIYSYRRDEEPSATTLTTPSAGSGSRWKQFGRLREIGRDR
jgi:acetyl-CoA carboxylase, biotin carboxylase subunit